ncbi:nitrate reductase [Poseidonibacter lekithochrous]|uniref:molybdopterin oxidoreductase family protein n=1 Tax=Poseidonibacter TaxID=2321187 RepID=UPI001C088FB3|nr:MULTISPECIES: nitrate reductase [Poseidonibacter]MBU3015936.1 nitrate reductase [Poseidonibacter lekithochrous]MDO6829235.1 nitrate reductase [Poseidonibacter sp. 1_MG-2023]
MLEKIKNFNVKDFLGLDIKNDKYFLVDDKVFGKVAKQKAPDKWIRSTCGYCGVGCGLYIGVKDGKPTYVKGDPAHPVNKGTLCPKGLSEHEMVQSPNRYTKPMIRKNGQLVESTWDEAFKTTSDKFKEIQAKHGNTSVGVISTGQLLTEEFYTLGKFVQLGLKTNNYDGNTTLCMASAVMGYKQTFGSDGPVGCYEDFSYADTIMLIGANIADNHPILKLHIAKNKKITGKKPKIIVIDPRFSKTAKMADIFVPIKPRSDLALMNGLAYIILEQGWEDEKFISERTTGFKDFRKHIMANYTPQEVAITTGIDVKDLYELARVYAKSPAAMSAWTMGVNQSSIATDTVSAICNLALITGNLGRKGATALSITGQCNAMGTRETGFTSSIPGYRNYASSYDREEYATIVNVPLEDVPTKRGYSYPQIIDAIEAGEIKALWIVATNPLVSFPDQKKLRRALNKLELLVVQDAFKSETSLKADVVFSASTWSEKEGTYTNSERRCNRARKAVEPLGDTKSDFDIVLEFSKYFEGENERLFPKWKKPIDAFNEWKKVSAGRLCDYTGMTYELIEELGGIQWPCNEANPKGTPRLYSVDMPCPTDDGKAKLLALDWLPLSEPQNSTFPLILNTGRTVEQWHTRTKTKTISILDDLAPEAWIEINPEDAKKLEVKSGERLDISSIRGKIKDVIVRESQNVREGNIFVPFHYNEQLINTITKAEFDPKSFEPNYKQCAVQLHSIKVPDGIKFVEEGIAGELEHIVVKHETSLVKEKDHSEFSVSKK